MPEIVLLTSNKTHHLLEIPTQSITRITPEKTTLFHNKEEKFQSRK